MVKNVQLTTEYKATAS